VLSLAGAARAQTAVRVVAVLRHTGGAADAPQDALAAAGAQAGRSGALAVERLLAVDSGRIMAWQRPDTPSAEQNECLPISRSAIGLPKSPTVPARRDRPKAIREIPDQRLRG